MVEKKESDEQIATGPVFSNRLFFCLDTREMLFLVNATPFFFYDSLVHALANENNSFASIDLGSAFLISVFLTHKIFVLQFYATIDRDTSRRIPCVSNLKCINPCIVDAAGVG